MALVKFKHYLPFIKISNVSITWCRQDSCSRFYSCYAEYFKEPVLDKKLIEKTLKEVSREELSAIKVKAVENSKTCSAAFDPDVDKFINYIMRKGFKEGARNSLEEAFTKIKHIQLRKYNSETDEEKRKNILLNPRDVFFLAIKNSTPLFSVLKIKKSGSWYKVPTGITDANAKVKAMKWLIETAKDKGTKVSLADSLAHELLAASQYEGRTITKKIELHKLCESNRSYLHFWWT